MLRQAVAASRSRRVDWAHHRHNELNPVAALILRTRRMAQRYGYALLNEYRAIARRHEKRVDELTIEAYSNLSRARSIYAR